MSFDPVHVNENTLEDLQRGYNDLNLRHQQLAFENAKLRTQIRRLEERLADLSWQTNPDRMGS